MQTINLSSTWSGALPGMSASTETLSADTVVFANPTIPATTTNAEVDIAWPTGSALKGYRLLAKADMTVKVNSTGSPDATINLKAGAELIWTNNRAYANPIGVAVTKLYVTNAGSADAGFEAGAIFDGTPVI